MSRDRLAFARGWSRLCASLTIPLPLRQGFQVTGKEWTFPNTCFVGIPNNDANSGHLVWGILIDCDLTEGTGFSSKCCPTAEMTERRWWHHLHELVRVLMSSLPKMPLDVGFSQDPTEAQTLTLLSGLCQALATDSCWC